MNRKEILEHANNLWLSLKEEKYRMGRQTQTRLQHEIERLGMFVYNMDNMMGHTDWMVGKNNCEE